VQNGPFQGERLPGRQSSLAQHLLFFLAALVTAKQTGAFHGKILATSTQQLALIIGPYQCKSVPICVISGKILLIAEG
jgi:hypothetical protein